MQNRIYSNFSFRDKIFNLINTLNWPNGFFRKDIGYKVIDEWELYLETSKVKKFFYQKTA